MKSSCYYILSFCVFLVGFALYILFFNDPRPKPTYIYSSSKTDRDITISLSNIRLAELYPQRRMLIVNVCVDNPNHYALSLDGKIVYPNGEKEIERGLPSGNPACFDYDFSFSPDDDLSQLEFTISSIRNWSYHFNEELVCAIAAEEQRALDEWNTGIKVSCRENGSSGEWIRQIDYVPSEKTDATEWINRASGIATDKLLITYGEWKFFVRQEEIYKYPVLTLLNPSSSEAAPQDIHLQASNLRKYILPSSMPDKIHYLQIDVCLDNLDHSSWNIWDAELKYDNGKSKRQFYIGEGNNENCKILSFSILPDEVISQAHLRVFGILFPPDMENKEKCKQYLPQLQKAINHRYFGLFVKCVRTKDEMGRWGIDYVVKPPWMSKFDVMTLIASQELYTVKGNWEFDLTLNP